MMKEFHLYTALDLSLQHHALLELPARLAAPTILDLQVPQLSHPPF